MRPVFVIQYFVHKTLLIFQISTLILKKLYTNLCTSQLLSHQSRVAVGDPQYPLGSFKGAIQKSVLRLLGNLFFFFFFSFARLLHNYCCIYRSLLQFLTSLHCYVFSCAHCTQLLQASFTCWCDETTAAVVVEWPPSLSSPSSQPVLMVEWCLCFSSGAGSGKESYYYGLNYFECWFAHERTTIDNQSLSLQRW